MPYRHPPARRARIRSDPGSTALLLALAATGLLPFVPAVLAGAPIEGQPAAGFGLFLAAVVGLWADR